MQHIKAVIQHIAPTLASALEGPFTNVATKFIIDNLTSDSNSDNRDPINIISELLNDPVNLQKIKHIDKDFKSEMEKLNVDVFSIENISNNDTLCHKKDNQKPQIIISTLFLVAYFLMLAAIFAVEASDTINMEKGDNSLMGELQILFGVLTAGVGQILSYWFGGVFGKSASSTD